MPPYGEANVVSDNLSQLHTHGKSSSTAAACVHHRGHVLIQNEQVICTTYAEFLGLGPVPKKRRSAPLGANRSLISVKTEDSKYISSYLSTQASLDIA